MHGKDTPQKCNFFLYSYQNKTLHNESTHDKYIFLYYKFLYSMSVLTYIFKFISRETCNTKKRTFHVYFYYVKFYCGRSKGKKLHFLGVFLPCIISTHLRLMRIKHISSTRIS